MSTNSAWEDFGRGCWTDEAPTTPGTYPVRRRDLCVARGFPVVQLLTDGTYRWSDDSILDPKGVLLSLLFWSKPLPALKEFGVGGAS